MAIAMTISTRDWLENGRRASIKYLLKSRQLTGRNMQLVITGNGARLTAERQRW